MKVKRGGRNYVHLIVSTPLLIVGIGLFSYEGIIVDSLYNEIFVMKENNYYFKQWKDPVADMRIDFYYFNWTNPQDLMNTSIKPRFEELGPFVFKEIVHKWNITFNDNDTISFRNFKEYFFQQDKSNFTLNDNITALNVIPLIASDKSRNWNYFLQKGLSMTLNTFPHHLTKPAKEWLFEGYEDTLLTTSRYLPLGDFPDFEKFAWFYQRNASASYEGDFNMGTGRGNTTFGKIYMWNFRNRSDYDDHCGELQAAMELYPQHLSKDFVYLFFPDFCRRVILDYNGTFIWNGIEVNRYIGAENFLDNGKFHPENTCLCNRKCLKFGVFDYSKCKFGIPAYISLPHFNKADPKYINDIEGMKPNDDIHRVEMLINQRTGVAVDLKFAVQLNLYLEPNPSISLYRDVPEIMFPVFWFVVNITMDTKNLILLRIALHLNLIFQIISVVLIGISLFLQMMFFYNYMKGSGKKKCDNRTCNSENLNLLSSKLNRNT
ncbi:protein croquemort-like [Harmonia axyridis]|uniref:protein croquemort-like n=1 Tax=Harmonia axyridis TaxID=115357 RepID=UPI001E279B5D|nr:protein croquemort-like [Harmonia axyridis]XP_045474607.1 protein croquemort-like [Harmonia axyridis]XP_045474608.1 protein croquemort-like [Harmonia axyridis]XP_045474609.1 protein croquemort-like [Harmonia axyridis]